MKQKKNPAEARPRLDFVNKANEQQPGLVYEFLDFLLNNKNWCITPSVLFLLLVGGLVMLTNTAAGPFIYTLF